jgi:hypothetical protein
MTGYIENGPKTKKDLKSLVGQVVTVISPAPWDEFAVSNPPHTGIAIVGPRPYQRVWYAQIWTNTDGKLLMVK